jgi:hypothetical protein
VSMEIREEYARQAAIRFEDPEIEQAKSARSETPKNGQQPRAVDKAKEARLANNSNGKRSVTE